MITSPCPSHAPPRGPGSRRSIPPRRICRGGGGAERDGSSLIAIGSERREREHGKETRAPRLTRDQTYFRDIRGGQTDGDGDIWGDGDGDGDLRLVRGRPRPRSPTRCTLIALDSTRSVSSQPAPACEPRFPSSRSARFHSLAGGAARPSSPSVNPAERRRASPRRVVSLMKPPPPTTSSPAFRCRGPGPSGFLVLRTRWTPPPPPSDLERATLPETDDARSGSRLGRRFGRRRIEARASPKSSPAISNPRFVELFARRRRAPSLGPALAGIAPPLPLRPSSSPSSHRSSWSLRPRPRSSSSSPPRARPRFGHSAHVASRIAPPRSSRRRRRRRRRFSRSSPSLEAAIASWPRAESPPSRRRRARVSAPGVIARASRRAWEPARRFVMRRRGRLRTHTESARASTASTAADASIAATARDASRN